MPPGGTVLLFGFHDRASPRQWSIRRWLSREGRTIDECHTEARGFWAKCRDLLRQYRAKQSSASALLVTFPGHHLMPLAWLLTRFPHKKLIFDAFLSLHDTLVDDRRKYSRLHPKAWLLFALDLLSTHLADEVLIDTEAHRQFFLRRFHLKPERVRVVYLEARTDLFTPITKKTSNQQPFDPAPSSASGLRTGRQDRPTTSNPCVFFYGTYIPLQGTDTILRAAAILQHQHPGIHLTLVGSGREAKTMQDLASSLQLTNVRFHPFVPLEELPRMMRNASLCLGIFGTSGKASRVIPHKVYDAVAMGIPVITRDSPAIREKFADHPGVVLCQAGNPEALASLILRHLPSA